MLTAKQAYAIASEWGSLMTAGDPGAVFYTFPTDNAAPQSDEHRAALLAYTDSLLALPKLARADRRDLQRLREFFAGCPIVPEFDAFTDAYLTAAFWTSHDDRWPDNPQAGEHLDANFSTADLDPDTLAGIVADCAQFQKDNAADLAALIDLPEVRLSNETAHLPHAQRVLAHAGHDFWLTRNRHGAGFWDGDYPEPYATRLTDAAHKFGGLDLYLGDDGKVYA